MPQRRPDRFGLLGQLQFEGTLENGEGGTWCGGKNHTQAPSADGERRPPPPSEQQYVE